MMVFGPKSCFAQFRILRFPFITVGKRMVGWLAMAGGASQLQLWRRRNHGEPWSLLEEN
jgi:hypothetical protein